MYFFKINNNKKKKKYIYIYIDAHFLLFQKYVLFK